MKDLGSKFHEFKGAAFLFISSTVQFLKLALLVQLVLLNRDVESSQYVRMAKDQTLKD